MSDVSKQIRAPIIRSAIVNVVSQAQDEVRLSGRLQGQYYYIEPVKICGTAIRRTVEDKNQRWRVWNKGRWLPIQSAVTIVNHLDCVRDLQGNAVDLRRAGDEAGNELEKRLKQWSECNYVP